MIDLLRVIPLFSSLNDKQLQEVADKCSTNVYENGTILFRENDKGTIFYLVVYGAIKIYTSNHHGEDKILSIFTSGDSFGELSLLDGKPRSATAQVIQDTKLISLAAKNFTKLLEENFMITMDIIKQLSTRLRETNQQVHDLTYMDAKQRVMKNLIMMANSHGRRTGTAVKIRMNLNFEEFSQLASVTKPLLFEVFQELQNKGILVVSGNEFMLDLSKIKS